jgi:hypothetical protein
MTKKPRHKHSSLQDHRRHRKTLTPPMLGLPNMKSFDWRLREPDMLWLASQLLEHPGDWRVVDRALDVVDSFAPKPEAEQNIIDGRLTTFEFVPVESRRAAREALIAAAPEALPEGLGHALSLFDAVPGMWLYEEARGESDPEAGLDYLRTLLAQLADSRSVFAVHARMLSLGRYFAHGLIAFAPGLSTVPLLARYPGDLSEDEKRQVRQFCKLNYDMVVNAFGSDAERAWGEAFWRRCGQLAAGRRT